MTRKRIRCLAVLFGTGCVLGFAAKPADAKPEELIKVTLEGGGEEFGIMASMYCLGADVVNFGGHGKDIKVGAKANDNRVSAGSRRSG